MHTSGTIKIPPLIYLIVLATLTLAVFANTLENDFVWDDNFLIPRNYQIKSFKNFSFLFSAHDREMLPNAVFRPVRTISFALDYKIWGLDPFGFHLTNLLLHTANVCMVYWLIMILAAARGGDQEAGAIPRGGFWSVPFLTALFFALHPIHTESVSYIKNRSDLLAFFFMLLTLLCLYAWLKSSQTRKAMLAYGGAMLCFLLALGSKAMALALPPILVVLCLSRIVPVPPPRQTVFALLPFFGLMVLYFWLRQLSPAAAVPGEMAVDPGSWQHFLIIIKTLGWYLKMMILPVNLNAEHVFQPPVSLFELSVLLSLAGLLVLGLALAVTWQRSGVAFLALAWILLTLMPVANIIYLVSRPIAEQRLYIPSLGFCLLLGIGLQRWFRLCKGAVRLIPFGVMIGLATFYAAFTIQRNFVWQDWFTLFSQTVIDSPGSARVRNNFGVALAEKGRYPEAEQQFKAALRINPRYAAARNNLGTACLDQGRREEAIEHFRASLAIDRDYVLAHKNLGVAMRQKGALDVSLAHLRAALRIQPAFPAAHYQLGLTLLQKGAAKAACRHFARALAIDPDYAPAATELRNCRK
ncbi:MAG: tetratricopeptide repeat protein [Desulfosudaceae bacterium]